MPGLRPIALIGLVSAAAAIAPLVPSGFQEAPRLDRPNVHSIIVRPDTVWFCARAYPREHRTDYAFVRSSRQWLSGRRSARCDRATPRLDHDDTVHRAGRGVAIRVTRSRAGADQRTWLTVTDSARKRRTVLRPSYTADRLKKLFEFVAIDPDTISTSVRDVVVNDSLIWIGLWGGFPEGEGVIGGVYRIDRRTGQWRHIVDATLADHAVNGLADAGGSLWIATQVIGETGPVGDAGLIRLRTTGTRRDAFSEENSPLPDALIQDVAADSRLVAVATAQGLAIGELGAKGQVVRWRVQHYQPSFIGDSLVMSLAERAASVPESGEALFAFLQRFAPAGRERPLYEATRRVDPDSLIAIVSDDPPNASRLLADPAALPAIGTLLTARRESRLIAANALVEMGRPVPSAVPLMRAAFVAIDTATTELRQWSVVRAQLGRALNRSGDSTALIWAREVLDKARRDPPPQAPAANALWTYNIVAAVRIGADAKDLGMLDQLLAIAPMLNREARGDLAEPLLAFGIPVAWQSALAMTDAGHIERSRFLDALRSVTTIDSAFAPRVAQVIVTALSDSSAEHRRRAVATARRVRLGATIPALIAAIDTEQPWLRDEVYTSLISLTGRADAPAPSGDLPRSAGDWWLAQQQAAVGGTLAVVPVDQGERAVLDWLRRRRPR